MPGSPQTYEVREVLRVMGLRWDPANHRWHGTTTAEAVKTLREQLRLEVRVFGVLEGGVPKGPAAPTPAPTRPSPASITLAPISREVAPSPHDGSRTHLEPRIALPTFGDEPEEFRTAGRAFSLLETTSGLPDDSREEDERAAERRLRDFRARVKRARAIVASTPGIGEVLLSNWQRAARFYARFGITEQTFRQGVPADSPEIRLAQEPANPSAPRE